MALGIGTLTSSTYGSTSSNELIVPACVERATAGEDSQMSDSGFALDFGLMHSTEQTTIFDFHLARIVDMSHRQPQTDSPVLSQACVDTSPYPK